jgi:hypothetical protein
VLCTIESAHSLEVDIAVGREWICYGFANLRRLGVVTAS